MKLILVEENKRVCICSVEREPRCVYKYAKAWEEGQKFLTMSVHTMNILSTDEYPYWIIKSFKSVDFSIRNQF